MALYAFDGTWNDSSIPESERNTNIDTNVHQFRVLYGGNSYYKDGVGTRYGMIGKLIGGLTGAGAQKRIEEQIEELKNNLKHPEFRVALKDLQPVLRSLAKALSHLTDAKL